MGYVTQQVECRTFNPQAPGSSPGISKTIMSIELSFVLITTFVTVFHIGVFGLILNRENLLKTIISLELLLLAVNLNFVIFSLYLDDAGGQTFVLFILVLSATESSIGLTILALYYQQRGDIQLDAIKIKKNNFKN